MEIQVLNVNYNLIHGNILSVTVSVFVSSNFIIAMYAVAHLYTRMSLPELIYFSTAAVDCFMGMLVCDGGFKANVNNVSKDISKKLKASSAFMRKRVMRRYLKSWPAAKIKLGSINFYDKETPLKLIEFSIAQIASLLLL